MATQIEFARKNVITEEMKAVAEAEDVSPDYVRNMIAEGKIVIPNNINRKGKVVGIGKGLRTKVNASIGTSPDIVDVDAECRKAEIAEEEGADTLMELSSAGNIDEIRKRILESTSLPIGNVPLYQAFCDATRKYHDTNRLTDEMLFDVIEKQCADGIAFMAIHCGINLYTLERLKRQGYRYGGLVSKGGATMVGWMISNNRENPLYEKFDRVVEILKKYDVVLSLGNGLRAGAIHDSADRAQVQELITNCELAEMGREMGCQTMVEGPGHIPLDEIESNIVLQKKMSNEAPYYMLGPLPTDLGAGYDHITGAIGAASSARFGADLICYITPAEHLALPDESDVREGVRATRLAAHIGDVSKYPDRRDREMAMSKARRERRWEEQFSLGLFGEEARRIRDSRAPEKDDTCTMCGKFCAMDNGNRYFEEELRAGVKG